MPKKKKYFPNNWKAYSQSPAEFFIPIEYDEFVSWKINGWLLPSSVSCIIREEDVETGRVKERVYSREANARRFLEERMEGEKKYIFTICDDEAVHNLLPRDMLTEAQQQQLDEEDYDEDE